MLRNLIDFSLLFYALFNSLGSIPVFVLLLKNFSYKKQQRIILRECIFSLIALLLFVTFGRKILQFLDISLYSFQLIGGVLLFSVALKMMLAQPVQDVQKEARDSSEPIFFSFSIPYHYRPCCYHCNTKLHGRGRIRKKSHFSDCDYCLGAFSFYSFMF